MKKIDKLILGAFLGPFTLTFVVVVFIFLTQYLLKYLDDFVGKGLGIEVYGELIFYFAIHMIPVSLPLAVLLSALMTYGNLGENFELTAIKGSGISLIRVMFPVAIMAVLLTAASFYFSNTIVPKANLKAYSLLYDIRQKKPSLDFKEGAFYNGLPGYSVKVSKKHKDGKTLEGLIIYNHGENKGNTEVILADSGIMYTINHDQYLVLELFNGNSFTEYAKENQNVYPQEFIRNSFKQSKLVFSLASFGLSSTPSQLFSANKVMKSVGTLQKDIDSMTTVNKQNVEGLESNIGTFYSYRISNSDTGTVVLPPNADSIKIPDLEVNPSVIYGRAANNARGIKAYISGNRERINILKREIRSYKSEKYRKYTQSCAVFIMFLIGAPLGAIIKKGGFGVPVIISIAFFIIYYVVTMIGEKWAKEGVTEVELGMWLGNLVLLPIGLFFLRQAKKDSRILETDFYLVLLGKVAKLFKRK
jgi:lipopolysaccharide export system permease protein